MKSTSFIYLFLISFLVSSCFEKKSEEPIVLPNNLSIQVEYLGDGVVKANFTAEKAIFYKVSFGTPGESLQRVNGNTATKTFTLKGDFTLQVQAHTTEKDFISDTKMIRMNAAALGLDPDTGYTSATSYDEYNLVWADEFSGPELSDDWKFELGDGCPNICGWGSNELQYYKKENTTLADGKLVITAKKESVGTSNYTSSRINTQGKQSFTFGRVDIRAKLPKGKGFWPSFWMLGNSVSEVEWPKTGAIHIMEMVGGSSGDGDATVFGTTYWDNADAIEFSREKTKLPFGIFNDEYHVFSIVWDAQKIVWLLDDVQYHVLDITSPVRDEFQKPFHFIINLGVGGREPGNPDDTSIFPQEMKVDYIRVFQKK
ncbi:MAG: glycoside hydrolase family 16 protein [Algoriphagus sp.]|uniref:glycoside hydrolase family 16 protein n=1 Tax=Algoriphagus sp. TaxID=1872435 RepID=UPI00261AC8D0|nr:glycoside hydrolase family 16 protein [Algoriphagus sp.]MDG1279082.1 glycoside hydrolase family 16 protein [Algoriphagus sp.]